MSNIVPIEGTQATTPAATHTPAAHVERGQANEHALRTQHGTQQVGHERAMGQIPGALGNKAHVLGAKGLLLDTLV